MHRLGLNHGGYHGEIPDVDRILSDLWAGSGPDWQRTQVEAAMGRTLSFLTRPARGNPQAPNIYLSAGIHGDEPAGPLALLELVRDQALPPDANLWICPCLNPTGCRIGTRENADGIDLNRDYKHLRSAEIRAHVDWLRQQPDFDLTILLHEDWEAAGFYLYELNPEGGPSLAEGMVAAAGLVCPVDQAAIIDGRETRAPGIIRPVLDPASRPEWPEAIWLAQNRTRVSYTLEAPSDYPMEARTAALKAAVRHAIASLA